MQHLALFLLFLLLYACAEQRPLSGGPKDTRPPKLDSARYSTPNFQTNFREQEIILTFDEWVVLNDPNNQILISPPLKNKPDVKIKYKSVVLRFKEMLVPNTTYSIQFGEAVRDYTENNSAENLRFVFSTGPVLDSLRMSGQLLDAVSGAPVEKVWVMLYDNLDDSMPYKERPLYIAKTDAQGVFNFENIRSDSFRVFALLDNNGNYKFDQKSEAIGFYPEALYLTDSTQGILKMRLFKEDDQLSLTSSKSPSKGQLRLQFNQQIFDNIEIRPLQALSADYSFRIEKGRDTLLYWYKGLTDSSKIEIAIPNLGFIDTIQLQGEALYPNWALVQNGGEAGGKTKGKPIDSKNFTLHPKNPGELALSRPIQRVDTSKIQLLDSLGNMLKIALQIDSTHPRELSFQLLQVPSTGVCELRLLPGALTDIWGETSEDTLTRAYKILKDKDLGNIKAKIINADSSSNYIIQLLDDKDLPIREWTLSGSRTWEQSLNGLEPKRYSFSVIHDRDKNGRFTNGVYLKKQQPETITRSKPIALRADWDNEMELDLSPPKEGKKGKK